MLVEGSHFTVDVATAVLTFGNGPAGELPPTGAAVTAVYLVPPVTRETAGPPATGPDGAFGPREVSVPSSARPVAPKLRYVIPAFGWEDAEIVSNGEVVGLTSTRRGNGVRIYLERPWWTSGEGELLGVVSWPPGELSNPPDPGQPGGPAKDADRRRPFVTMWGQDPIYGSRLLPVRFPQLDSFPGAVASDTGLTLAELGSNLSLPVNVAGHTVGFDQDRDLWYCDMEIASGPAYSPMVRLALARWQPASIQHAELSRVVVADVVQLAPDRFRDGAFRRARQHDRRGVVDWPDTHPHGRASGVRPSSTARVIVGRKPQARHRRRARLGGVGEPVELHGHVAQRDRAVDRKRSAPRAADTRHVAAGRRPFELLASEPLSKGNQANPFITIPIPTPRLVHTDIVTL